MFIKVYKTNNAKLMHKIQIMLADLSWN